VRQCWGQENVEAGRPVTEHTVFDLASLSKQFTALAVVRLVGEGRVSLTAPLSAYIADFASNPKSKAASSWPQVTVQHLMHHTSGLGSNFLSRPACPPEVSQQRMRRVRT
jgi:CubicO group peptidase (beta-lactamase class C family)